MIESTIAKELNASVNQVDAAIKLLDEGATVPFIARYRKEATNGLSDTQLRTLEQRLVYLRELAARRQVILKSIKDQDKLNPTLEQAILSAANKTELEDLYLPYKPKRRTKGQIAIEAGLQPLATAILDETDQDPEVLAIPYINEENGLGDVKSVLDGAKFILIEQFAENADVLSNLRNHLTKQAHLTSKVIEGMQEKGDKFTDYFDYSEQFIKIPSHRALAMFRGRNEGFLSISLDPSPETEDNKHKVCEDIIHRTLQLKQGCKNRGHWLNQVINWTWRIKLSLHLETELFAQLRERAEIEAIDVFSKNLKDLLMAAPAGPLVTMGLDPGLRTGVKVAVVDQTGKVVNTTTIYPHAPQKQWDKSVRTLEQICRQYKVKVVSIGNGTGSRETDKLVSELIKSASDIKLQKIVISEAGASVYSASELASNELPDLDVSLRGAVSIARRLQDPLAELVKIEPKAIGVGQYQHDVNQSLLAKSLDNVIEDCVNAVGVDLNTASTSLLAYVSGLNRTLANNIVAMRDLNGAYASRSALKNVDRLGPKAFEQAAGFLRIADAENPLDASAVHPEAYVVVDKVSENTSLPINELIGNDGIIGALDPKDYVDDAFGLPTIKDVFSELIKPGRDPRPAFKTAKFKEGVSEISDLKVGMLLEGVVSNVANFGAFVDIGVHQDGLVHISAMTNKFIKDPREVVKTGDLVNVRVTDVDIARKRIALTMKLDEPADKANNKPQRQPTKTRPAGKKVTQKPQSANAAMGNAFAEAFANAKKKG
ncbi:MAG: Tex family protein [Pseudomonadota bacterium]